jgi:hypothetical protein
LRVYIVAFAIRNDDMEIPGFTQLKVFPAPKNPPALDSNAELFLEGGVLVLGLCNHPHAKTPYLSARLLLPFFGP